MVRTFERYRAKSEGAYLSGGTSDLVCGHPLKGYRHILKDHRADWEHDGRLVGTNWRDQADWSIEITLRDPHVVTHRAANNSFCYSRAIQLWDKSNSRHIMDRIVLVIVSGNDADIITAYPKDRYCRADS